jgi:hypothetical protein
MDAVKAKTTQSPQALQATKRPEVTKPKPEVEPKPEPVAAQKKPEQPRPTTNAQGETIGRRLNVTA